MTCLGQFFITYHEKGPFTRIMLHTAKHDTGKPEEAFISFLPIYYNRYYTEAFFL